MAKESEGDEEEDGDDAHMDDVVIEAATNKGAEAIGVDPMANKEFEASDSEPIASQFELIPCTIAPDVPQIAVMMDSSNTANNVGDQFVSHRKIFQIFEC